MSGKDRLSRAEIRKDAVQETFTATTHAVGAVAGIIVGAVGDIGRTIGGYATELFEIRDSTRRASTDHADADQVVVQRSARRPGSAGQPKDI